MNDEDELEDGRGWTESPSDFTFGCDERPREMAGVAVQVDALRIIAGLCASLLLNRKSPMAPAGRRE